MNTPDNSPSRGTDEITQLIEEAKESVKREVEAANSVSAKKELAEELRDELKRIRISVEEVLREQEQIQKGRRLVITKSEEAKKNLRTLIRAVEAAKRGVIVGKTNEAQVILIKLAEIDLTPSTASALEYYLTDYLVGNKRILVESASDSKSEFERDFENLAKTNFIAAQEIIKLLEEAVNKGKITSLTKEKIEKLKSYLEQVIQNEKKEEREREARIPTKEEVESFIKLWRRVNEKIGEKVKTGELSKEKLEEYNRLIFNKEEVDVEKAFRELGFTDAEAKEFSRLRPVYHGELNTHFMEQHLPRLAGEVHAVQEELGAFFQQLMKRNERGELIMEKKDRQRLKNIVRKYLYYGLKEIHENKSTDFHHALQERSDVGYYFGLIHQVIGYHCERIAELIPPETSEGRELRKFLIDLGGSFISRTLTFAQIFHNLPLYVRDIGSIENISKMFAYIYPSQLAELFDDETAFMMVARDELTMLIREYLVSNDNIYGGDFLSGKYREEGCYWNPVFRDNFIDRLREKLKRLGIGLSEEDEWKMSMFSTYAEGIGIATLTDGEILATSRPVGHIRDVHPLMQLLSAKFNWLGGRGERDVGHLINRFLLGMDVELLTHERPLLARLIKKKKFIPDKIADLTERRIDEYGGKMIEGMVDASGGDFLFDMGGLYQELISMFTVPGALDSWHGWRVQGVTLELNKIFSLIFDKKLDDAWKSWNDSDWRDFFDLSLELYGTTSIWWQIGIGGTGNRVSHEIKRLFLDLCGGDINKVGPMYNQLSGDSALAPVIDFQIDDPKYKGRKISFLELRHHKMNQLRGEVFFRFLRRNPGEFLALLSQLVPEILKDDTLIFKSEAEIRKVSKDEKKTENEINQELAKRAALERRWGKELFELFGNLHQWLGEKTIKFNNPTTGKPFTSRENVILIF
ncbi:MAG: hypothetical protein N2482_01645 [Patescibacteria group bacterium]|nr:hypothetical protein [Patescibacteria group bacterium]